MTNLTIEIARQSSADLLQAVTSLLSQLTTSGRAITAAELDAMIASPAATLFLAKDGDRIVGMISLAVVQMPTGLRSYLEDLVVDEPRRGFPRKIERGLQKRGGGSVLAVLGIQAPGHEPLPLRI